MDGNRKHLLERFQEHLDEHYQVWCERHDVRKSDDRLVTFLIDQELIPSVQIKRYAVRSEFEKLSKEPIFNKTQIVNTLAHRFNISERTVWNILKHGGTGNG
jgi:predicted transcriptional regulator YheO